jgi:hypothetical protein
MSDLLDFSPPGQTTFTLAGARARFFDAGTTTLRTVYTDQSETVPHPDPLLADGSGRWPQAFVSGGPVKVVVTQADGSTGYTLDPCEKVAAAGAGASAISFAPTVDLPFTNVQAAIEGAAASAAAGFAVFGLGVAGSVGLIANINATNTASGVYRFDNTTTGTFPTGVAAADTGAVRIERETAGSAWMVLYHDTTDRTFIRRMNASTWGAWRENIIADIGAVQGDILFRSATNWTRLAPGTSGQVLRTNGAGANPSWGAAGAFTMLTAVATTSGTAFDFTVPSTATEILVDFDETALSGTDGLLVQLIDGGGAQTSGYISGSGFAGTAGHAASTAGMIVHRGLANDGTSGSMVLTNRGGLRWVSAHSCSAIRAGSSPVSMAGGGAVTLDDACVGVRITRTGTNTFNAGALNVGWR